MRFPDGRDGRSAQTRWRRIHRRRSATLLDEAQKGGITAEDGLLISQKLAETGQA